MALTHSQGYTDNKNEDIIFAMAERFITMKNRFLDAKTILLTVSAKIAADANASAELKTLGVQATGFVNNANFTDFIAFIENNLE